MTLSLSRLDLKLFQQTSRNKNKNKKKIDQATWQTVSITTQLSRQRRCYKIGLRQFYSLLLENIWITFRKRDEMYVLH